MKKYGISLLASALLFSGTAFAAQFSLSPATETVSDASAAGTAKAFTLQFDNSGMVADASQATVQFDKNQVSVAVATEDAADCYILPAPNDDKVQAVDFVLSGSLNSKDLCTLTVTLNADNNGAAWAAGDVVNLTIMGSPDTTVGYGGADLTGDLDPHQNATITVTAGDPPDVIAGSTPVDGTAISIPGGAPGDTNSTSVDITIASGDEGTVSVTSCTVGAGFTIVAPGAFPANAPVTIEVEATLGAAALADTLNCVGTDSSAAGFDFSWPISAPEGTLLAGPTVSSNPSSANPLQLPTNTTGNPVSVPVTFTPNGGDVGGPDATVACAVSGAFTVTPANLTLAVGDAPASVAVGCSPGAVVEAGSLTCTVNDETGANDIVWELVCPEMSVAPAAPTFVPASSLWSKLALFGMLGALGMLVLGLRRNH